MKHPIAAKPSLFAMATCVMLAMLAAPHPARAQETGIAMCPEDSSYPVISTPGDNVGEPDDTYLNLPLTNKEVYGVRPPLETPMPAKSTARITDLTTKYEFLFKSADDRLNIYTGYDRSRGTAGATKSFGEGLFGPKGKGCQAPGTAEGLTNVDNDMPMDAESVRRQVIDCANQYILAYYNNPKIIFDPQGAPPPLVGRDSNDKLTGAPAGPELCQPLKLKEVTELERGFTPSDYLYGRAPNALGIQSEMENAQELTFLNELTTKQYFDAEKRQNVIGEESGDKGKTYERILDPSHPFSPRYDYDYNEREKYSPATFWYQFGYSNPKCAVACASVPVDVMRFRAPEFNQCVSERISVNMFLGSLDPTSPLFVMRVIVRAVLEMEHKFPVCSTRFDQEDRAPEICQAWLQAKGAPLDFKECCAKLRQPVIPVNLLKIRTNDATNFPQGAPKGYTFKEYFGTNMPYMRWWDTGTASNHTGTGVPPVNNVYGSLDSIVGVGREKGQNCAVGGGEETLPPGTKWDDVVEDRMPARDYANYSWGELKLYQARTRQKYHLSCLGRYEKLWKDGAAEDFALTRPGGSFIFRAGETRSFPYSWRGYVSDSNDTTRFPKFGSGGKVVSGLSNAQAGDIIIWDDPVKYGRLPHVSYVLAAQHKDVTIPWIRVTENNYGKYPDSCGTTEAWGNESTRTLYKDKLPDATQAQFNAQNVDTDKCTDPGLSICVEPNWGDAKFFRPTGE